MSVWQPYIPVWRSTHCISFLKYREKYSEIREEIQKAVADAEAKIDDHVKNRQKPDVDKQAELGTFELTGRQKSYALGSGTLKGQSKLSRHTRALNSYRSGTDKGIGEKITMNAIY